MPLVHTSRAIGEVVDLVSTELIDRSALNVTVGRPEPSGSEADPRLNLFLYEAEFDASMRNLSVFDGHNDQLWLVLRFILTAFDANGESDTIDAHRLLGRGLAALREMSYLDLPAAPPELLEALEDNPERIKITLINVSSDLLARVMQGSEERYRFSMGLEVRPVMIAAQEPADYALLVGIDYTTPEVIGEEGIQIGVLANMGVSLASVDPPAAAPGETMTIHGQDLSVSDEVRIGTLSLSGLTGGASAVSIELDDTVVNGSSISAGQHPLWLVRPSLTGHPRSSNLLSLELLPVLSGVAVEALSLANPGDPEPRVTGTFRLEGELLGAAHDHVFVALYAEGETVQVLDDVVDAAGPFLAQTRRVVTIPADRSVPVGTYRVIVRVNNAQARSSPEIVLSAP